MLSAVEPGLAEKFADGLLHKLLLAAATQICDGAGTVLGR